MEISKYFKSIIEQDRCAVVICNLENEIIYMNPTAIARYQKRGGAAAHRKKPLGLSQSKLC